MLMATVFLSWSILNSGTTLGKGPGKAVVPVHDPRHVLPQHFPAEDVALLELDLLFKFAVGQKIIAFERDRTDPELVAFLDIDAHDQFVIQRVRGHLPVLIAFFIRKPCTRPLRLGPRPDDRFVHLHLDIPVIVIEVPDRLKVFFELIGPEACRFVPRNEKNQCSWFLSAFLISSEEMALLPVMIISVSLTLSPSSMVEDDIPVSAPELGDDGNNDSVVISRVLIFEPDLLRVFLDQLQVKGGPGKQRHAFLQLFRSVHRCPKGISRMSGFSLTEKITFKPVLEPFRLDLDILEMTELIKGLDVFLDLDGEKISPSFVLILARMVAVSILRFPWTSTIVTFCLFRPNERATRDISMRADTTPTSSCLST